MIYWIAYYCIKLAGVLFAPRTVLGKEHIPRRGGFIIASNHISNLDPFLIGLSLQRRISYMAKESLFQRRILKFLLRKVEAFPVRRGASDVRALREAVRRLKRGLPIVMFPEGTRGASGIEKRPYFGIGFLALKSGAPVCPVHISGSDAVLPPSAKFPRRGRIILRFGEPLQFSDGHSYSEILDRIMTAIKMLGK